MLLGVFAVIPSTGHAATNNLTALLQQGLFEEQANRNLDAAIENYATLAKQFDKDRQLAATAVFRLGECYRAQGKTNEAAAQYQRILGDFADQKTLATLSQQNLAGMGGVVPARGLTRDSGKPVSTDAGIADEAGVLAAKLNGLQTFKGDPERYAKAVSGLFPDDRLQKMLENLAGLQTQEAKLKADPKAELNAYRVALSGRLETLDLSSSVTRNLEWAAGETRKQLQFISERVSEIISEQNFRLEVLQSVAKASPSKKTELPVIEDNEDKEIRRIQQMIQNSPDLINAPEPMSALGTPLVKVAYYGWLKAAAFLLDHGADVNGVATDVAQTSELRDFGKITPFVAAVAAGNKAMTQFLIEHGANVNFKGENNGVTPLHLAARKGYQAVVEVLLANHADANARDNAGQTPLFSAVQGGQIKIIQMLVAAGADPNLKDGKDNTVLNFAIKTSPEMFQALLAAGTDPNTEDAKGRTPLSYAVERDSLEVVKMLLAAKADPNARSYNPPLMCAIADKNLAAAETLLKAGANPNAAGQIGLPVRPNSADLANHSRHLTPLWLAVYTNQPAMVQLLLKYKADPNDSQTDGRAVVFSALGKPEILTALLDAGAKADVQDQTDNTAIPGGPGTFQSRLQRLVNPDLKRTPLLYAAGGESNVLAVAELLQHGANPSACDGRGNTALHYAAMWLADEQVFALLLNAKANPNVRNNDGQTPLDLVKERLRIQISGSRFPNQDQSGINYGQVSAEQKSQAEKLIALLHQHGALDNLPDWDRISISRPSVNLSSPVFMKNTNDWNHFTLLELLLQVYPNPGQQNLGEPLTKFPDLSGIVIMRPSANGAALKRIPVNLLNATNGVDCSRDVPLEFGDVVEIPEREHTLAEGATFLTKAQFMAIQDYFRSKSGEVKLVVSGAQTVSLLLPPMFSQIGGVLMYPNARAALTSKSDLSRVKVIRHDPKTGKKLEWILDCAYAMENHGNNAPDLWLRNGDVIEVPEKP